VTQHPVLRILENTLHCQTCSTAQRLGFF